MGAVGSGRKCWPNATLRPNNVRRRSKREHKPRKVGHSGGMLGALAHRALNVELGIPPIVPKDHGGPGTI